jgi:hypothetical protein
MRYVQIERRNECINISIMRRILKGSKSSYSCLDLVLDDLPLGIGYMLGSWTADRARVSLS